MKRMESKNEELKARLLKKVVVNKETGCWEWTGSFDNGYGRCYVEGKRFYAHRYSYELTHGKIPKGLVVCHKCNNPHCVNPEHLFVETRTGCRSRTKIAAEQRMKKHIKVNEETGCWEWTGIKKGRYGRIYVAKIGKQVYAHRYSYELTHGKIPKGLVVCHKCDNPSCVNPEHLFAGTQQENVTDKEKKGRGMQPKGERVARAKLTKEKVVEIRNKAAAGVTYTELAKEYGITASGIREVVLRETWKHVN